ncbi:MAG: HAD family phosphatase [Thermomicrobia bacterium]|nr:HAD family phosphatase [Thermomicrobia bacterium]
MMFHLKDLDFTEIQVLLCDADGNLFPSEEPAFVASAAVTNRFLRAFGAPQEFTPETLRRTTTGKNFRSTITDLAVACGIPLAPELAGNQSRSGGGERVTGRAHLLTSAELERWVAEEKEEVSRYLRAVLTPDPGVIGSLSALSRRFILAVVTSSAISRLDACFTATALARFFPEERRFSAEDSLPTPKSKPDPAIYTFAATCLGITPGQGLAIEDSVPGTQSAVAAGFATVGNLCFVPPDERSARKEALQRLGVVAIIEDWEELVAMCSAKATLPISP